MQQRANCFLKVMSNVYHKVGQTYYGFLQPPIRIDRRPGRPRNQHNSELCQACRDGECDQVITCGTHLFVKVPRSGDSEVTFSVFESSCHCYYQFNHSKVEAIPFSALPKDTTKANLAAYLHTKPFKCWTSNREAVNTNFKFFGLTRPGIEPRSTDYEANVLIKQEAHDSQNTRTF